MQDQQVEVVSGPHAVARVAGAVVLVAHRGTGRPTADSPAVRALVALAELVYEAAARQPEGPGATIARDATRWLMTYPERAGTGPVDFGILSAAGPDRVAIFLHGAVTAVVAGEHTEYFHGRDAAFTVDRTASVPSRAVALFVDDPCTDTDDAVRPELPAVRGIGRLVEGIAEAGGVIAWAPAVRRPAVAAEPGRSSGVVLGKGVRGGIAEQSAGQPRTRDIAQAPSAAGAQVPAAEPEITNTLVGAAESPRDMPDDPPVGNAADSVAENSAGTADIPATGDARGGRGPVSAAPPGTTESSGVVEQGPGNHGEADAEPAGHGGAGEPPVPRRHPGDGITATTPPVDSVQLSERATVVSPGHREHESSPPARTDPHHAQTEISGRQPPRGSLSGEVPGETADARPGRAGSPRRPPVHPTPHVDMPVSQPGPGEPPRPDPAEPRTPPLDAELRRRTEATAKGTALTVKVPGFKCARAHPTDPRSAFCSVCGMPVDQTQPLIEVMRPALGILVLDDGSTYLLETDSVLGRDPEQSEPARRGLTPLQVTDNSGGMSRAHAELLLIEWDVTLVDRGSTNGTRTRAPGFREWVRIPPHRPVILAPGTEILIGNRMLRLESAAPPPFGS